VDRMIYSCNSHDQERDRLKGVITRTEQWPVSRNKLVQKYYKNFKQFTDNIRTYIHTYILVHIYIHTYTCMHTYIRTCIRTYIHAYIHTYVHTYIRQPL
jgi:hypothetical protein